MSDDGGPFTVAELAEYCQTQAGLLSGRVQTIGEEADALLDEIDDDIAGMRTRLADRAAPTAAEPPATEDPDVADLERLEEELQTKQALVEAKQARMAAFQDLAAGYVELAEELEADADNPQAALERVVAFEGEADAPTYFQERRTILEAAAAASDRPEE
jgi:predicted TIM-barrel fold metal-dependent hydrolase